MKDLLIKIVLLFLFPIVLFFFTSCDLERDHPSNDSYDKIQKIEFQDSSTFKQSSSIVIDSLKEELIESKQLSDLYLENISYSLKPIPKPDVEPPIEGPNWEHTFTLKIKNIGQSDFHENLMISSNFFDKESNKHSFFLCLFKKKNIFKIKPKINVGETKKFIIRMDKDILIQNKNIVFTINPKICKNIPKGILKYLDPKQKKTYRPIKESDYTNNSFNFFLGRYTDWATHGR